VWAHAAGGRSGDYRLRHTGPIGGPDRPRARDGCSCRGTERCSHAAGGSCPLPRSVGAKRPAGRALSPHAGDASPDRSRRACLDEAGCPVDQLCPGGIVDEFALAEALAEARIGGAGIDSLETEPPLPDNPLLRLKLDNLIVTPHVAWASQGSLANLAEQLIQNIEAFVLGSPRNLVA